MKQTISTVLPPPPPNRTKTTTTHAKNTTKIEWVSTGLSNQSPTPHTPPPLPSFFAMQHLKTFDWHFAGGPMVARHCVLAGIGYVHVLYRHLVALH